MSHVPEAWTRYLAEKAARQAANPTPVPARPVGGPRRSALAVQRRAQLRQTVRDMAAAGADTNQIAAAVGMTPRSVRALRQKLGISASIGHAEPQRRTIDSVREWLALRQQGYTWAAIGLRYDRCGSTVRQQCQRWGHLIEEASS